MSDGRGLSETGNVGLRMIATGALEPNDWNPNQMTEDEIGELVAEVRHLGRLPKPIVAREVDGRLVIVDGEHGWRAACEVGLAEVPVEVIDADPFEAMRQTYKRNQHGTHNPVLLGRMFKRMLAARGLSQRALAGETEVSEGTIRNALVYAEAADLRGETDDDVRNGYAHVGDRRRDSVAKLTVRQARRYVELPEVIRDEWVHAGADEQVLQDVLTVEVHWPGQRGKQQLYMDDGMEPFQKIVSAGLAGLFKDMGFRDAATRAFELLAWRSTLKVHLGDEIDAYLAPVADVLSRYRVSPDRLLDHLPLRETSNGPYRRLHCPLPPERWAAVIQDTIDPASRSLVWSRLRAGVTLALRELDAWDADEENLERDPVTRLVLLDAPDFVRDAKISLRDKVGLVGATFPDASAEELLEVKQSAVPLLEHKHRLVSEGFGYVGADGQGVGPLQQGRPLWGVTPDKIVSAHFEKRRKEQNHEARKALFASRSVLVSAIVRGVGKGFHDGHARTKDGRKPGDVLAERLDALPWPELVLLGCVVTGEGDPGETWFRALDDRNPATRTARRPSLDNKRRLAELEAQISGKAPPA